jgi:putative NADH-flavin reductase
MIRSFVPVCGVPTKLLVLGGSGGLESKPKKLALVIPGMKRQYTDERERKIWLGLFGIPV